MLVYRITLAKWAESLSGSGYPARWNPKGYHVVYCAGSRALACLENLVHRSGEGLNANFKIVEIHIPDTLPTQKVETTELPDRWHLIEGYPVCQTIGKNWLALQKTCILRVPSSIIQDEWNLLINPNHPEFRNISIQNISDFSFDNRLVPYNDK
jgi:RES domain-containing protein